MITLFLIKTITTSSQIKPEWFTGCQDNNMIRVRVKGNQKLVKFIFGKTCLNLISCSDTDKTRSNCQNDFFKEMNHICNGYAMFKSNLNSRQITCLEISKRNFELVKNLDSFLFKSEGKKYRKGKFSNKIDFEKSNKKNFLGF